MAFNTRALGEKLTRYRQQFQYSVDEVSNSTGIPKESLKQFEQGSEQPSGDEVLILTDFYKCDYKFFLSNEKLASFEQTETLFRKFGEEFSKQDRWAIQECLFLAECEAYLEERLNKKSIEPFTYQKKGTFFKGHAKGAAESLRHHLGYKSNEVSMNIYNDMRRIGIRVFRRRLDNSNISGICIMHPIAGQCVLINYSEDIYRQRFTAAHETAHTFLDEEEDVLVSFERKQYDLKEVRANTFASTYLIPTEIILKISDLGKWTEEKAIEWASKLKVNTQSLAISLLENGLIDDSAYSIISNAKVPRQLKEDPELRTGLSPRSRQRKLMLLERGLSDYYVLLCFEAYKEKQISASRLTEMLLLESDQQLSEMAELYGVSIKYAS